MHRWTLTALLTCAAAAALWLAPSLVPVPTAAQVPLQVLPGEGPMSLTVRTDAGAVVAGVPNQRYLVLTVATPAAGPGAPRLPVDLALVMDTSGSMSSAGKLAEAQRAGHALVDALAPEDRLSLVTFSDRDDTLLPLGFHEGPTVHALLDTLSARGSTNLSGGLSAGFDTLGAATSGRVRTVLLLTDGRANRGLVDDAGLSALARRADTMVSTVGLGRDYDEALLASMADAGGGAYHYVDAATDLTGVYEEELSAASTLAASDGVLEVDFGPGVAPVRVLNWPATITPNHAQVRLGNLAAGQSRTVVVEVQITAPDHGTVSVAHVELDATASRDGTPFRATGQADVVVVANGDEVAARVDREAMTVATRAVSGWNAVRANEAWRQGDGEQARAILRDGSAWISRQGELYGLRTDDDVQALEALGYVEDGAAQKQALSLGLDLSRGQ
jgi:hypothetical protein